MRGTTAIMRLAFGAVARERSTPPVGSTTTGESEMVGRGAISVSIMGAPVYKVPPPPLVRWR